MIIKLQRKLAELRKNKKGFTLTEMLVVVAIISALAVMMSPDLRNAIMGSRKTVCEADLKVLGDAVLRYYTETGNIPEGGSIEDLKAELIREDLEVDGRKVGPYMKENMNTNDPWGHPYEYRDKGGNKYDICSKGSPDDNKEICYNTLGRREKK